MRIARLRLTSILIVIVSCTCGFFTTAAAQQLPEGIEKKIIANDLANPMAVAIRPVTAELFVAEGGSHTVVRFVDGKKKVAIEGFGSSVFGAGKASVGNANAWEVGPTSLVFLNKDTIIVGCQIDDRPGIRVFQLTDDEHWPMNADRSTFAFVLGDENRNSEGNHEFENVTSGQLTITKNGIYAGCNEMGFATDPVNLPEEIRLERAWRTLARSVIIKRQIGEFRFMSTTINDRTAVYSLADQENDPQQRPSKQDLMRSGFGVAISPQGEVVLGHMGSNGSGRDSFLEFFRERTGKLLGRFECDCFDLTGLAFSPSHGRLYGLDFSWHDPAKGALIKIVESTDSDGKVSRTNCQAEYVLPLVRPTSIAFDADGNAYVVTIGGGIRAGQLLKISGLD